MKKSTAFSPKKTVVSNVAKLKKNVSLVQYNSSSDEEVVERSPRRVTAASKNGGTPTTAKSTQIIPSGDKSLTKSFLMWENNANVCWLDASMALLVHNKTLTDSLDEGSATQIVGITRCYYEAVGILNDYADERHIDVRVQAAKDLLKTVQESTLKYLQPILKYKEGEPDSAFCSLYNLITEDKSVKDFFDLEFTWVQVCKKCNNHRVKKHKKPIVTLPRVAIFQAGSPIAIYQCPVCKEPDQNMMLNFKTLPQCLLFHFESGAGKGELQCKDFEVDGRTYRMTGVMTLEKGKESNVNHFITFIRDPSSDTWLECNDLNDEIMCFCMIPPFIELEDVYIIMYEAADRLGTVENRSIALDKCGLGEESVSGGADIPLIDLADDTENSSNEKGNRACNQPKEGSRRCKNVGLLETCEDGSTNPSCSETLNVGPTTDTGSCVSNGGTRMKELTDTTNRIAEISEDDAKVADESEIFMRNLDLCQKTKLEKSLQNKNISPLEQIKNLHSVSKINKFEIINLLKINSSPTLIGASNKLNDISNTTAPGSPQSQGQMLAQTYQKLMNTLDKAVLKKEIPLATCTESDKNEVPNTELSNELVAKELKSEFNKTKPVMVKLCKDLNFQVPNTNKPTVEKAAKKLHSEPATEIPAKAPQRYVWKTQPKQRKQEPNVDVTFEKDSKQGRIYIRNKILSQLTVTTTEIKLLSNRDTKSSSKVAVNGVMGKMNKTQTNLEPNKSHSDIDEYNKGKVDAETKASTTLAGPNKKRELCKSDKIYPHKKKGKKSSEQAVQPKKQCRRQSVCDSISVDIERPILVDTKKDISVEEENPVPERIKHKRVEGNSTSPQMVCDMMEQTAFTNTPIKTYSKRNLVAASPKSPLQRKNQTNFKVMTDNLQGDPIRHSRSSNDCRHTTIDELLPSNSYNSSQIDSKRMKYSQIDSQMECKEGCDCNTLDMDETFDVIADGVLNTIFSFFDIRKH